MAYANQSASYPHRVKLAVVLQARDRSVPGLHQSGMHPGFVHVPRCSSNWPLEPVCRRQSSATAGLHSVRITPGTLCLATMICKCPQTRQAVFQQRTARQRGAAPSGHLQLEERRNVRCRAEALVCGVPQDWAAAGRPHRTWVCSSSRCAWTAQEGIAMCCPTVAMQRNLLLKNAAMLQQAHSHRQSPISPPCQ